MAFRIKQHGFTAGELAPELHERSDTAQYHQGLAKARNVYTVPQGGFARREGTQYLGTSTADGGSVGDGWRIFRFEFSATQAYLIVLTHNQIEILDTDGTSLVVLNATNGYAGAVYPSSKLAAVRYLQTLDTVIFTHEDGWPLVLQRINHTTWHPKAFEFEDDTDKDSGNFNGYWQPWGRFIDADALIRWDAAASRGANRQLICNKPLFHPLHIGGPRFRKSYYSGSITVQIEVSNLPSDPLTGTVTFTSTANNTEVTGVGTAFDTELYPGDYIYLAADTQSAGTLGYRKRIAAKIASIDGTDTLTLAESYQGTIGGPGGTAHVVRVGDSTSRYTTATDWTQAAAGTPIVQGTGTTFLADLNVGDRVYNATDDVGKQYLATKIASIDSNTQITLDRAYGGNVTAGGKDLGHVDPSGTAATAAGGAHCLASDTVDAVKWVVLWDEALISPRRGFPRSVALHQDRLTFGGTTSKPDTLVFSKSSQYYSFDDGRKVPTDSPLADDSFWITLTGDQINPIEQLVSHTDLVAGTIAGAFSEANVPVTPDTAGVTPLPRIGWANIKPVVLEGAILFVSDAIGGKRQSVLEMLFSEAQQTYVATDISLLAFHLLNSPTTMALRMGNSTTAANHLFVVNAGGNTPEGITAGTMAVLNTLRSQQITGWTLWETDGVIRDATTVGGEIFLAVERTINGSTAYYIEKLNTNRVTDCSGESRVSTIIPGSGVTFVKGYDHVTGLLTSFTTDLAPGDEIWPESDGYAFRGTVDAVLSDTSLRLRENYTGAAMIGLEPGRKANATVSGLAHLEGKTVDAVADGEYLGQYTVSGGQITLSRVADMVEVGLPFAWQVVTLPQDLEGPTGSMANTRRRLVEAHVSVLNSQELRLRKWGDTGAGQRVVFKTFGGTPLGAPPPATTDTAKVMFLGYDRTGQLELFGSEPYPVHVRALTTVVV